MGQCYEQFSLEERCTLSQLSQAGKTVRQIAAAMDRAPSTIARELKRNSGTQVGYQPAYAEQQAKSRRWRGSRLLRKPDLQQAVLKGLGQGWSPAQVAGRLKKEQRRTVISHETIYRFIDSQIRRTKDYSWRHYLPRGKSKRGWRGHKGGIGNAIGRMRRGLPRKTDLATLSDHRLLSLVRSYNHTPRNCLNYKTPAEVFCHELLHLKCESTFRPAPE